MLTMFLNIFRTISRKANFLPKVLSKHQRKGLGNKSFVVEVRFIPIPPEEAKARSIRLGELLLQGAIKCAQEEQGTNPNE